MKYTLYICALFVLVFMLALTACGQTGPLVAPPAVQEELPPAADDMPGNNLLDEEADEQ